MAHIFRAVEARVLTALAERGRNVPVDDLAKELGLDQSSVVAEPQFVDAAARDYRLKPGTPGAALATDGGPVGARFDLSEKAR